MKKKILSWLLSGALLASTLTMLPVANLTPELTADAVSLNAVTCSDWDEVVDAIEDCSDFGIVYISLTGDITADEQIEIDAYSCIVRFRTANTITDTTDESLFYLNAKDITLDFGDITLKSTVKSEDEGGAVYVNDKDCKIKGGTFNDYKSEEDGGAIYVNGDKCSIGRSNFNNCESDEEGGAIYVDNVDCTISNCQFRGCKSKGDGGAIYMSEEGTISTCGFNECQAEGQGGAICNDNRYGGDLMIEKCNFAGCKSKLNIDAGEGYYMNYVYGNNNACILDCNRGDEVAYFDVKWIDFTMEKGHVVSSEQLKKIIGEAKEDERLDIYIDNDLIFTEEIRITRPCKIYLYGPEKSCTLSSSSYYDVEAVRIFYVDAKNVELHFDDGIKIKDYGLKGDGAAIYVNDYNCLIDGATFDSCASSTRKPNLLAELKNLSGGAIYVDGEKCTISNCTFEKCSAKSDGGAICINRDDCTIEKCEFTSCSAEKGGAIYVNVGADDCTISECTFTDNNATVEAGSSNVHGRSDTKLVDCKIKSGTYTGCVVSSQNTTGSIFSEGNVLILFIVAEAATVAITALVTMNVIKKKSK